MWRRFSEEERQTIWDMREAGVPVKRIARHMGRPPVSLRKFLLGTGGKRPSARERSELRLVIRSAIAASLGRSPSTVCREVNVNGGQQVPGPGGRSSGVPAGAPAQEGQARSVPAAPRGRRAQTRGQMVAQQISAWLALEYPDRPEMQVSHETIYQSLFVQSRGALRKELHSHLRSGRAMRRPKAYVKANHIGQGKLKDMVMISERPAEVKDRAVPGHWEGDLIFGKKMTSIGTLVERHSRYVILLKLPNGHGAEAVHQAMTKRILTLPAQLRRSITWDQGKEMAEHVRFRSKLVCRSTSVIPRAPGSAGATRTPTVCCATTSRSPQTSPKPHSESSTPSPARSTRGLDRPSVG